MSHMSLLQKNGLLFVTHTNSLFHICPVGHTLEIVVKEFQKELKTENFYRTEKGYRLRRSQVLYPLISSRDSEKVRAVPTRIEL